ncbi:MAG: tRNA preQ1(34) S-adenosylmethionine ribosyltransferase-isomerase QueA [Alphaproteobacteria bacterium]|nr:tRNA preQ1(34) S-adenosylmethionine ribosyltransferase-isomerase QueA [Alphaproteobacteria bacterium]
MRVALFDFNLPPERIAYTPAEPRESAKLLHVSDTLSDKHIADVPEFLDAGDIVVFNNSKVIPARLFTNVGEKQVEVLLHRKLADGWSAFAKPARKLKEGMTLTFGENFHAEVTGRTEDGQVLLRFEKSGSELHLLLERYGHMPLPPYISRDDTAEDKTNYQTVYARHEGSVAAPTAGLHFTQNLLEKIKSKGVQTAFVTLHVGAGTFQPVKVEDTAEHVMHHEWAEITQETADAINAARAAGGRVIAVGTTSLRILETVAAEDGILKPYSGDTNIFITPGYRFRIVDRLMTNFHLPKSTLFMLVSAFAGLEKMQQAYAHAIANQYRFYSYGDACLLERSY